MNDREIGADIGVSNVQRTPCVLVLDTSGSMAENDRIDSLNRGLAQLEKTVKGMPQLRRQLLLAVVRFASDAEVVSEWTEAAAFSAPQLVASGTTAMGKGMTKAYELVERIRQELKSRGIQYTRPWIFLLSDGSPTDDWQGVAAESRRHCTEKHAVVWPFLVGDGDDSSAATLHQFAREDMSVYQLEAAKFGDIFEWLSSSLGAVANSGTDPHAQIAPPPAPAMAISTYQALEVDVISSIDRDCGALTATTLRVSFASVTGPSHVRKGASGDDAAAAGITGDTLVAVVCDGAGSAPHGGAGARMLAPAFVEYMLMHAGDVGAAALSAVAKDAIRHGRSAIESAAATATARLSSFATTLVACVATPSACLHVQIGDGAMIAFDACNRPAYLSLGRDQEYANETYFATDRAWEDWLLTHEIERPRSVLLMTDGVVPFALDEQRAAKTAFCVPIVEYLRDSDSDTGARALLRLLNRPDVADLVADDKTLLWLDVEPVSADEPVAG